MKYLHSSIVLLFFVSLSSNLSAQGNDSTKKTASSLQLGGYGEAVYIRNFFSDSPFRYMKPESHKNDPSHGRFDLPHVVFFVGYEFGKGWRINSEIEFEHGGTESAVEVEAEEGGEYESEIERGGEVVLEQFWVEKTFNRALNLRVGHIIVPVGFTNGNHLPTEFFTVYRPEGERTILPCTWHETGISLWGRISDWRYEVMLIPGLDSELFSNKSWIGKASASPYEFKIANRYAGVARIDNYSVKGLRMGVSAYYGHSFTNSVMPSYADKYKKVKGTVIIGSFDFKYDDHNIIARGYLDYGHLSDAQIISLYNRNLPNHSPSSRTNIASDVVATGLEAGYDIFSPITKLKQKNQKFYIFGRYEYYDSMFKTPKDILDEQWCARQIVYAGINYFPIKNIVIKAEYSTAFLKNPYNNESSLSLGIAYSGFFK
ncbi:MAG: hypothetical protein LBT04_09730 [Prevotellaceae bacterium]|jgi:hypothetical protein|nr:hypothetical protein [Prevotellaceae bacterium]